MGFFLETLLGGLMAGMLYSLVALGFVLIFKASGVFNFAQRAMVLFAALAMARFSEWVPKWTGIANAIVATLAASAIAGVFMFESVFEGGVLVNKEDVIAAAIAATLVLLRSIFLQKTKTGRALRAVADDHQAAQSIGIPLNRIWVIVWSVAGFVALTAGVIWGSKLGVQFSLSLVALKALPVVILGGLTSVPGAILGGLLIGVGEKVSEVYVGPMLGGGIEIWFGYVLVRFVLLVRPQGLFGEQILDQD